jgi:hypothetical protein
MEHADAPFSDRAPVIADDAHAVARQRQAAAYKLQRAPVFRRGGNCGPLFFKRLAEHRVDHRRAAERRKRHGKR